MRFKFVARMTRLIVVASSVVVAGGCNMIAGIGKDLTQSALWTQDKFDHGFGDGSYRSRTKHSEPPYDRSVGGTDDYAYGR